MLCFEDRLGRKGGAEKGNRKGKKDTGKGKGTEDRRNKGKVKGKQGRI